MTPHVLQINFKFSLSRDQYEEVTASLAQAFADVPGCLWKVWLMNEADREAGGIYLFADEAAVERFKGSDLAKGVLSHPALSGFSIKQFEVLEDVSRVTRGPLPQTTTV